MTESTVTGEPTARPPAIDLDLAPREWLLSFVAGCPVVLEPQLRRLLVARSDAPADLVGRLVSDGLLVDAPRLRGQGAAFRITAAGLRAIGSDLSVPRVDLRRYWRDVAAGWLAVAVRRGAFGEAIERLFTRREMVAADRRMAQSGRVADASWSDAVRAKAADASFAVRLDGDAGAEGAHYPDVTVVIAQGRVAMELVMTYPGRAWLEKVVQAYARKPQLMRAFVIVPGPGIRSSVAAVIERCGVGDRVVVQQARFALW